MPDDGCESCVVIRRAADGWFPRRFLDSQLDNRRDVLAMNSSRQSGNGRRPDPGFTSRGWAGGRGSAGARREAAEVRPGSPLGGATGLILGLLVWLGVLGLTGTAFGGATVRLRWDPSPDADVANYRLYHGFSPGTYVRTLVVPATTTNVWIVVTNLPVVVTNELGLPINLIEVITNLSTVVEFDWELPVPGETNYFSVTARNSRGIESEFSNEAAYVAPPVAIASDTVSVRTLEDQEARFSWRSLGGERTAGWLMRTPPVNGSVTEDGDFLVYSPRPDAFGEDPFHFYVLLDDGVAVLISAAVTVEAVPEPPVAFDNWVITESGKTVQSMLSGIDVDGDPITYRVVVLPEHGQVTTNDLPAWSYTSEPGFVGEDRLMFRVNDGERDSELATVRLLVERPNQPPVARDQQVETDEDVPVVIELSAEDPEGWPVSFEILESPRHGVLTPAGPTVVYQPNTNFFGSDRFQFAVTDPAGLEAAAVVTIEVRPVDDPPVVEDIEFSAVEGVPKRFEFKGSDPERDQLDRSEFEETTKPKFGRLIRPEGEEGWRYLSPRGFVGEDQFEYVARSGELVSAPGRATVRVISQAEFAPQLEPSPGPAGALVLTWRGRPGRYYNIRFKPSLDAPEWILVGNVASSGSGLMRWRVDTATGGGGFYAVELLDP